MSKKAAPIEGELKASTVPSHLTASSRAIWISLNGEYEFTQADLATLLAGLENRDLATAARAELRKNGAVLPGSTKTSPYVVAAKTADMVWLACCRQLGLHLAEAKQ